jgi:membrane-associated protease RseP (regulator of RpoE activity)
MKNFLRLNRVGALLVVAMLSPFAGAETRGLVQVLPSVPLLHSNSQGYLGVDLMDVDQEKAQALKLKEVRGAVITLIDHDAPAGKIGLKVNDVVVKLNGQIVEGAEQLRRMLREIPAGRQVSLEISRDGNLQTLAVQLADRRAMEHEVWNSIGTDGDLFASGPGMGILAGGGNAPLPGGFHIPFFGSSLNVGAMVEPLTSQMAEYLGVPSGLMVKEVMRKSEAAAAGLKAFDVILKVGTEPIATLADWERSLRANQGKPVQVTVLRDKKQQTLTLQVESKRHGELEFKEVFVPGDLPQVAGLDPQQVEELRRQAETIRENIKAEDFKLDQKQLDEIKQQAEEFRKDLKIEDFKLSPQQLDQLKQKMEDFRKNFKVEDFKLDPKQMNELRQQMDQLKRQIEEIKAMDIDGKV